MKSTIDYLFKDVSDNKEGKALFGFSAQTVKKCINDIEQNYFQGRKIYHGLSKSKNNAIIFRCEIKGLLLLLLKLELEDVFRDDKAKTSGISNDNIDKIIGTYLTALDQDLISDYEYRVLMQFSDIDDTLTFLDTIKEFRDELSRLLIILATKYHDHPSNYCKMFIKRIRDISVSMIYGSNDLRLFNSQLLIQPLDLRKAIIRAINTICSDLYYFKQDNICRRHLSLNDNAEEYLDLSIKFNRIRKEHICVTDGCADSQREKRSDELPYDVDSIVDIREELSDLLEEYYKKKYPHISQQKSFPQVKKEIEKESETIKDNLSKYLMTFIKIQRLCYGIMSEDESNEIYKNETFLREFYSLRYILMCTNLCDWSFANYLPKMEFALSKRIRNNDIPTEEEIAKIVEKTISDYRIIVNKNAILVEEEFDKICSKDYLKNCYGNIIDNIDNINKLCDTLAKNLIAMILKRESDNDKENKPF